MRYLYWVRNDLRLHDNQCLLNLTDDIVNLDIVFNWPKDFDQWGEQKQSFLKETLWDFQKNLEKLGQKLFIQEGDFLTWLDHHADDYNGMVFSKSFNSRDKELENQVLTQFQQNSPKEIIWCDQGTMIAEMDLPFSMIEFPKVFTKFRKKVEKNPLPNRLHEGQLTALPPALCNSLISYDKFCVYLPETLSHPHFKGGETEALKRLHFYLWDSEKIEHYKETRNGMIDFNDSSKFSPWLANGSLSPRLIQAQIEEYENIKTKNDSTYWLYFELLWRDFFKFNAEAIGEKLFSVDGLNRFKSLNFDDTIEQELFETWTQGKTNQPFVNANMIELRDTGWMSNRGRQNVASYLAKGLRINWLWGAEWFAKNLIDYDVESNYGNWAYLAGVGADPRDRVFNIERQAETYDPDKKYQNLFLKGESNAC